MLPGAAPNIFAGLKQSVDTSFFMFIAEEMMSATTGLGRMVLNSQVNFQIPRLFVTVVIIAVMGLLINYLIESLERKVLNWKEESVVN